MIDTLLQLGIAGLRQLMRRGDLSPIELTAACLDHIDGLNPALNAFLAVTADAAMEAARAAERAYRSAETPPALLGIPIALKDNIAVSDMPMTAGSPFLREHVADKDASVVTRLREAGAVLIGKLNMHEWAIGATSRNPHFGPVRNPWDPHRVAGGSSGGSGAAVAAGMVPAALGTDTGGSGRIPAALTGVSGLRPSAGLISTEGVVPMSWTFDTVAPIARRAEDVDLLLHILSSTVTPADMPPAITSSLGGTRLGLVGGFVRAESDPRVWETVQAAGRDLETLGAIVEEIELPGFEAGTAALRPQQLSEAAAYHQERLAQHPDLFGPDVLTRLTAGTQITGLEYARAREASRRWWRDLEAVFTRYDLLILPTCGHVAPIVEESDGVQTTTLLTRFTAAWSSARVPALSVHCGFVDGLPVGMQIVAPRGADRRALWLGSAYQQVSNWHVQSPIRK